MVVYRGAGKSLHKHPAVRPLSHKKLATVQFRVQRTIHAISARQRINDNTINCISAKGAQ